jgi:hypothetical protein
MYPLIYHLGVDDYLPNEDFEPHRFRHIPGWQRHHRRPSLMRRLGWRVTRLVRDARGRATPAPTRQLPGRAPGMPVIRWG